MGGESPPALLEIASGFAEEAGRITLKYFQGRFDVDTKSDASFVTTADREAEAFVRAAIESRFPEGGIVGEGVGGGVVGGGAGGGGGGGGAAPARPPLPAGGRNYGRRPRRGLLLARPQGA